VRLDISDGARDDLARIYVFNFERSEPWADRVQARLEERCQALTHTPRIGRPLPDSGHRRLSVTDIQYVIDYRVTDTVVEILRFQHTREIR
jgi:plasmid stabilization system protein ParE